jgi:predicted NUDIX family NTP pyrophosphohydrolase
VAGTAKQSAGIVAFRRSAGSSIEVLLVHPGGPLWRHKEAQAWSIPKGELAADEDALAAARREFLEELGFPIEGEFVALAPVRQRGGKTVHAFAVEADFDTSRASSNTFSMEWPPRSGRAQEFPEIDRAEWFSLTTALEKINAGQAPLLQQLREHALARG